MLSVDTWLILKKSIGNQFSGLSNTCEVLLIVGFIDSDFVGHLDKRRSLTGYIFTIGGCAVSWRATLQSIVACSTTDAEYMAILRHAKKLSS